MGGLGSRSSMPENSKQEEELKDMILSHTCPICFELLIPPMHSPYILSPCGHNFCESCLKNNEGKYIRNCPCCRASIKTKALNIDLQNLITNAERRRQESESI